MWDARGLVLSNWTESWCLRLEWPVGGEVAVFGVLGRLSCLSRYGFGFKGGSWYLFPEGEPFLSCHLPFHWCWYFGMWIFSPDIGKTLVLGLCLQMCPNLILCVICSGIVQAAGLFPLLFLFWTLQLTTLPLQPPFMLAQSLQTCEPAWVWCSENWGGSYCGHPQYTAFP